MYDSDSKKPHTLVDGDVIIYDFKTGNISLEQANGKKLLFRYPKSKNYYESVCLLKPFLSENSDINHKDFSSNFIDHALQVRNGVELIAQTRNLTIRNQTDEGTRLRFVLQEC